MLYYVEVNSSIQYEDTHVVVYGREGGRALCNRAQATRSTIYMQTLCLHTSAYVELFPVARRRLAPLYK